MAYLLDANIFIQAKNLHYGFDFCPAFWDWLIEQNAEQKLFSIEQVGNELTAGDDELSEWAHEHGSGFFRKLDTTVGPSLQKISTWAISQNSLVRLSALVFAAFRSSVCSVHSSW